MQIALGILFGVLIGLGVLHFIFDRFTFDRWEDELKKKADQEKKDDR